MGLCVVLYLYPMETEAVCFIYDVYRYSNELKTIDTKKFLKTLQSFIFEKKYLGNQ